MDNDSLILFSYTCDGIGGRAFVEAALTENVVLN
ncbi:hypothetical protein FHW36_1011150 [Chitinophaga polysaccharea]|uniref:Uncharacterized protein n=1 Tax=Chitinophaga polysaccharea TaxID=1293035 RepID=A0A561Q4C7_9BACT|nr:hypothetical protein FHW36_1011150 [Chitinophaga polysaccharea]